MKKFKFSRTFKFKIDLNSIKLRRGLIGFWYFMAGSNFTTACESLADGRYFLAAWDLLFMAAAIYFGTTDLKTVEKAIELDSHLEGYKHGLSKRNGR